MMVLFLILGLVALVVGAEALVRGASRMAISFGVSPLVVGLTIVAFGTSAPEGAVSVGAVLGGTTDLAMGNVIGSNIFNILVIVGLSALVKPLIVHAQIVRQELPVMTGSAVLLVVLVLDGRLQQEEAILLFIGLLFYTTFLVRQSRAETRATADEYAEGVSTGSTWDRHWSVQVLLVLAGVGLLVVGSEMLVSAAVDIARSLGVSDLVIGLTIIAAGTSLPEVATSVMAALRGQRDIAVGNVIGSNTFNILFCLGAAGSVTSEGLGMAPSVMELDIWVMIGVTFLTVPLFMTDYTVTRMNALLLLGFYLAYTAYLILDAQRSPALAGFSEIMMTYVLPTTIVILVVMMVRAAATTKPTP